MDQDRGPRDQLRVDVIRARTGCMVITPVGEVDMVTAPLLAESVGAELAGPRHRVVINLSRLSFFGSSGLAVLLEMADRARRAPADLGVVAGSGCMAARVLETTGVRWLLPVFGSVAAALSDGVE